VVAAIGSSVRELALLPALAAVMIAGTIASPAFLTSNNLTTVVQFRPRSACSWSARA